VSLQIETSPIKVYHNSRSNNLICKFEVAFPVKQFLDPPLQPHYSGLVPILWQFQCPHIPIPFNFCVDSE
jgi:hypothetical protein